MDESDHFSIPKFKLPRWSRASAQAAAMAACPVADRRAECRTSR